MSQGDNLNLAESFKARDVNNRSFLGVATIELVINQLSLYATINQLYQDRAINYTAQLRQSLRDI